MPRKKKWNAKDWYRYHQQKEQSRYSKPVEARFERERMEIEASIRELNSIIADARRNQSYGSWILSFFGIFTNYYIESIYAIEVERNMKLNQLQSLRSDFTKDMVRANELGAVSYATKHSVRREKRISSEAERKVRRLERSSKVRLAARLLRPIVYARSIRSAGRAECHYCKKQVTFQEWHMEHKTPVSRGGRNKLDNLAISCPSCNLRKGRRTEDEFLSGQRK